METANPAESRPFTLPGPIGSDIPFRELHAWGWAQRQPRARVNISDYLADAGFVLGRDRLTPEDYDTLSAVFDHFHRVAPHLPGRVSFADAMRPAADGESGFYVQGKPGRYVPSDDIRAALIGAGWIYDVEPETTYFSIGANGILWARYQQIIGSRPIVEIVE